MKLYNRLKLYSGCTSTNKLKKYFRLKIYYRKFVFAFLTSGISAL